MSTSTSSILPSSPSSPPELNTSSNSLSNPPDSNTSPDSPPRLPDSNTPAPHRPLPSDLDLDTILNYLRLGPQPTDTETITRNTSTTTLSNEFSSSSSESPTDTSSPADNAGAASLLLCTLDEMTPAQHADAITNLFVAQNYLKAFPREREIEIITHIVTCEELPTPPEPASSGSEYSEQELDFHFGTYNQVPTLPETGSEYSEPELNIHLVTYNQLPTPPPYSSTQLPHSPTHNYHSTIHAFAIISIPDTALTHEFHLSTGSTPDYRSRSDCTKEEGKYFLDQLKWVDLQLELYLAVMKAGLGVSGVWERAEGYVYGPECSLLDVGTPLPGYEEVVREWWPTGEGVEV